VGAPQRVEQRAKREREHKKCLWLSCLYKFDETSVFLMTMIQYCTDPDDTLIPANDVIP
jgi:hypothetical protein